MIYTGFTVLYILHLQGFLTVHRVRLLHWAKAQKMVILELYIHGCAKLNCGQASLLYLTVKREVLCDHGPDIPIGYSNLNFYFLF